MIWIYSVKCKYEYLNAVGNPCVHYPILDNQSHVFDFSFLLCDFCSFIGEESVAAGAPSVLTDNPTWIIDPVDGTTNFVHRYCLAEIIYKPLRNPIRTGVRFYLCRSLTIFIF